MFVFRIPSFIALVVSLLILTSDPLLFGPVNAQPSTVSEAAKYVLKELGYPATPKLIQEVERGIRMLQEVCPRFSSMPIFYATALIGKYSDTTWERWEELSQGTGLPTSDFVAATMIIVHESMRQDLSASPPPACIQ